MEEYVPSSTYWQSAMSLIVLTSNLVVVFLQFLQLEENSLLRYRIHVCCYRQDRYTPESQT